MGVTGMAAWVDVNGVVAGIVAIDGGFSGGSATV